MHTDPDDIDLQHSHFACRIPAWAAAAAPGRAYARWKVGRIVRKELAEKGWTRTGTQCWHFGTIDGASGVIVHFTVRDALATAYANSEADR